MRGARRRVKWWRHRHNGRRGKGSVVMDRWGGFGVIADNLIDIGRVTEQAAAP
jgi:hypothetical protein